MKFLICGLFALVAVANAANELDVCHKEIESTCSAIKQSTPSTCNSLYSGFGTYERQQPEKNNDLSQFANDLIHVSYKYLLLSKHFETYIKNRPGLAKLYKSLADDAWEKGVEVIKHITLRGGTHSFNSKKHLIKVDAIANVAVHELKSLAIVLDTEKRLAVAAHRLHEHYSHVRDAAHYDPEIAHYIEEEFIGEQAKRIRTLSGYSNDLKRIILKDGKQNSVDNLGIYLFDQYLQKL